MPKNTSTNEDALYIKRQPQVRKTREVVQKKNDANDQDIGIVTISKSSEIILEREKDSIMSAFDIIINRKTTGREVMINSTRNKTFFITGLVDKYNTYLSAQQNMIDQYGDKIIFLDHYVLTLRGIDRSRMMNFLNASDEYDTLAKFHTLCQSDSLDVYFNSHSDEIIRHFETNGYPFADVADTSYRKYTEAINKISKYIVKFNRHRVDIYIHMLALIYVMTKSNDMTVSRIAINELEKCIISNDSLDAKQLLMVLENTSQNYGVVPIEYAISLSEELERVCTATAHYVQSSDVMRFRDSELQIEQRRESIKFVLAYDPTGYYDTWSIDHLFHLMLIKMKSRRDKFSDDEYAKIDSTHAMMKKVFTDTIINQTVKKDRIICKFEHDGWKCQLTVENCYSDANAEPKMRILLEKVGKTITIDVTPSYHIDHEKLYENLKTSLKSIPLIKTEFSTIYMKLTDYLVELEEITKDIKIPAKILDPRIGEFKLVVPFIKSKKSGDIRPRSTKFMKMIYGVLQTDKLRELMNNDERIRMDIKDTHNLYTNSRPKQKKEIGPVLIAKLNDYAQSLGIRGTGMDLYKTLRIVDDPFAPREIMSGFYPYQNRLLENLGTYLINPRSFPKPRPPTVYMVTVYLGGGKTTFSLGVAQLVSELNKENKKFSLIGDPSITEISDVTDKRKTVMIYCSNKKDEVSKMMGRMNSLNMKVVHAHSGGVTDLNSLVFTTFNQNMAPSRGMSKKDQYQSYFTEGSIIVCHTRTALRVLGEIDDFDTKRGRHTSVVVVLDEIIPGKFNSVDEHSIGALMAYERADPYCFLPMSASIIPDSQITYYMQQIKSRSGFTYMSGNDIILPAVVRETTGKKMDLLAGSPTSANRRILEVNDRFKRFISNEDIKMLQEYGGDDGAEYIDRMIRNNVTNPSSVFLGFPYHSIISGKYNQPTLYESDTIDAKSRYREFINKKYESIMSIYEEFLSKINTLFNPIYMKIDIKSMYTNYSERIRYDIVKRCSFMNAYLFEDQVTTEKNGLDEFIECFEWFSNELFYYQDHDKDSLIGFQYIFDNTSNEQITQELSKCKISRKDIITMTINRKETSSNANTLAAYVIAHIKPLIDDPPERFMKMREILKTDVGALVLDLYRPFLDLYIQNLGDLNARKERLGEAYHTISGYVNAITEGIKAIDVDTRRKLEQYNNMETFYPGYKDHGGYQQILDDIKRIKEADDFMMVFSDDLYLYQYAIYACPAIQVYEILNMYLQDLKDLKRSTKDINNQINKTHLEIYENVQGMFARYIDESGTASYIDPSGMIIKLNEKFEIETSTTKGRVKTVGFVTFLDGCPDYDQSERGEFYKQMRSYGDSKEYLSIASEIHKKRKSQGDNVVSTLLIEINERVNNILTIHRINHHKQIKIELEDVDDIIRIINGNSSLRPKLEYIIDLFGVVTFPNENIARENTHIYENRIFANKSTAHALDMRLESVLITEDFERQLDLKNSNGEPLLNNLYILQATGRCGRPGKAKKSTVYMSAPLYKRLLADQRADNITNVVIRYKFYTQRNEDTDVLAKPKEMGYGNRRISVLIKSMLDGVSGKYYY